MLRLNRMWPGANGSLATFISTKTKSTNKGNEALIETMVIVALQETLLPRSKARRRKKTALMSTAAPRKSIRASFFLQSTSSCLGKCMAKKTVTNATAHSGT